MPSLAQILTPRTRAVPRTAWSADGPWRARWSTLVVLVVALAIFGCGEGLLIQAQMGATPWTVLAQGITHQTSWPIGVTTLLCSGLALIGWIPLRQPLGFGTIANAVVIPLFLQITTTTLSTPDNVGARLGMSLAGIAVMGLGGAGYITCAMGPGPRDGLMTGLQRRLQRPIAYVRLGIEVAVMSLGWLMGGRVGIATALFAFLIGHVLAYYLGGLSRLSWSVR